MVFFASSRGIHGGIRLVLETAHILVAEARIDHLLHDHFLLNDPEIPEKCTVAVPRNG